LTNVCSVCQYPIRPEHLATQLIATSLNFVTTRRAFEVAIDEARRAGWPDDEVCRVTGLSRHTVEAVAGRRHDGG
jgi:hypothetical protein